MWVWVPFEVDKKFDGYRLDRFLAERLVGYSRSRVQKILAEARVHKGGRTSKSNQRVKKGDKIEIAYLRQPEKPLAPAAALPVLYEDEHLLIVNKPADLLSKPMLRLGIGILVGLGEGVAGVRLAFSGGAPCLPFP